MNRWAIIGRPCGTLRDREEQQIYNRRGTRMNADRTGGLGAWDGNEDEDGGLRIGVMELRFGARS